MMLEGAPWDEIKREIVELRAVVERLARAGPPVEAQRLFTRKQAARLLGISPKTLDRRVKGGFVRPSYLGEKLMVSADEIRRLSLAAETALPRRRGGGRRKAAAEPYDAQQVVANLRAKHGLRRRGG